MTKKEEFFYDSSDGKTEIHAIKWIPEDVQIRAVLQISHGMLEHIKRYHDFAQYLAERGILVVGNDHLGHGDSLDCEENRGFFCEKGGNKIVLEDIDKLKSIMKKDYPDVPYFMLGHSMGSYLLRQHMNQYDSDIQGAIIMGTGHQPYALLQSGLFLTKIIAAVKGYHYRSKLVDNLAIGGYNKHFEPCRTSVDWLSRDEKIVDEYLSDPKINFIFTLNAYYNMFKGMLTLYDNKNLEKISKDLPILLISGENDPVGNFGKDVKKLYEGYKNIGLKDVNIKLYKDSRHEIINEIDRKTVYEDVFSWIIKRIT